MRSPGIDLVFSNVDEKNSPLTKYFVSQSDIQTELISCFKVWG